MGGRFSRPQPLALLGCVMKRKYNGIIIGTGTAGYTAAIRLTKAGKKTAVIDKVPYGGTCALRGCQAKKYLVAAAEAIERGEALVGLGLASPSAMVWQDLIRSKNEFTGPIPESTEAGLRSAGIDTYHGQAEFTGLNVIRVEDKEMEADRIVIATGARPRSLDIPGEELVTTSDRFLDLDAMPDSVLFIGGGYISFEFAHVAAKAGAKVTIVHRSKRPLPRFDRELVARLIKASEAAGIRVVTEMPVVRIKKDGRQNAVIGENGRIETFKADLVVHGAGRVADISPLQPDRGNVQYTPKGIRVNDYMQSVSNPSVYAIGDAADTPFKLAPVTDLQAEVAAQNIIDGNRISADYTAIPSVVFSLPPLAGVGLTEKQAQERGIRIKVNSGDASGWASSRRIGQKHAAYKVLLDPEGQRILGAHLLGHNAGEMINIFAMAIKFHLTTDDLKSVLWAYPTHISDIKYMI